MWLLINTPKLFTGQRLDGTGLYYYNARYYDPQIGRFISADTFVPWSTGVDVISHSLTVNAIPIGLGSVRAPQGNYPESTKQAPVNPQNLNRYSYVVNSPLCYEDPYGFDTWMISYDIDFGILFGGTQRLGLIWDNEGNWAILSSATVTVGGLGLSVSGGFQWTNADTIWQVLDGKQVTFAAQTPVGSAGYITDTEKSYQGGQVNAGIGFDWGVTASLEFEGTVLLSNEMMDNLRPIDALMWSMYLTGDISQETYTSFNIYCMQEENPWAVLFYIVAYELSLD